MRVSLPILFALSVATSCKPAAPSCGDGVVDALFEWCDDGDANADVADACRLDCTLPRCGDTIVDAGETCDDGEQWGGDGCTPGCQSEDGTLEQEPNDSKGSATGLDGPGFGGLPEGDRDCWGFDVGDGGYVRADVSGDGGCPEDDVRLELLAPSSAVIASATPDIAGCSPLDPVIEAGARYLEAGRYAVCVQGLLGREVRGYRLDVETGDSCTLEGVPFRPEDDTDRDGEPDVCDDDDDDDGLDDDVDNCPKVSNNGEVVELRPSANGWIRTWLGVWPLTGVASPDRCLPTADRLGDDATAIPALGVAVEDQRWRVVSSPDDRINFDGGDAPRESYLALWVEGGAAARDITLSLGPDDGARAWWNGEVVLEDYRCQGTNRDGNEVAVVLQPGWNRLLVKIYDQGGGWGLFGRFKDEDGAPMTDLRLSLQDGGPWAPDQTDSDGDGLGDVCDPTPFP